MGTGITKIVIITRKLLYAIKHTQKYIDEWQVLVINFFDSLLNFLVVKPSIY